LQDLLYDEIDGLDKSLTCRELGNDINDIHYDCFESMIENNPGVAVNLWNVVPQTELIEKRSVQFDTWKYDIPILHDLECLWIRMEAKLNQ
jgi:hypothetical protein